MSCCPGGATLAAARRSFSRVLRAGAAPAEVTTDRAPVYPRVLDELVPSALHTVEQYANNPIETDHGRLKAQLRPMRGLKRQRSARILAAGRALQTLTRESGLTDRSAGPGSRSSHPAQAAGLRGSGPQLAHSHRERSAGPLPDTPQGRPPGTPGPGLTWGLCGRCWVRTNVG